MILTLHTETVINSAHQLDNYDGKCANIHGHSWLIEVWFKGDSVLKDNVGILVDFGIVKKIHEQLDHTMINYAIEINPTAENLVEWIYDNLKTKIKDGIKIKVRVHESVVGKSAYCEGGDFE